MFSFKGIGIKIFALILAIVAIVIGIYLTFFHSSGFVKTQAMVTAVEKIDGIGDETDTYEVSVEHTTAPFVSNNNPRFSIMRFLT